MVGAMAPDNELFGQVPDISFYNTWIDIIKHSRNSNSYVECFIKYAEFYIEQYNFDFLVPVLDSIDISLQGSYNVHSC